MNKTNTAIYAASIVETRELVNTLINHYQRLNEEVSRRTSELPLYNFLVVVTSSHTGAVTGTKIFKHKSAAQDYMATIYRSRQESIESRLVTIQYNR